MLERVLRRADEFDILHFHVDFLHFPMFRQLAGKMPDHAARAARPAGPGPLYRAFPEMPLVSISDAQRGRCRRQLGRHGPSRPAADLIPLRRRRGGYLAFLGRISPEKRPDRAIEIARRAGMPLQDRGQGRPRRPRLFRDEIEPLLDDPLIEFVGEIGEAEKAAFLGGARALLFPIDWPEPFGLVMIEAMAAGTPVIALRCGSVPEVIEDGVTGFIVDDIDEAVAAVDGGRTARPRARSAPRFEERFTAERMARDYVALYERLIAADQAPRCSERP